MIAMAYCLNNIKTKLEQSKNNVPKLILDEFNKIISINKGWTNIKQTKYLLERQQTMTVWKIVTEIIIFVWNTCQ